MRAGPVLTQTGPPRGQASLPALETDHPALEGPRGPGGRGHIGAHVGRVGTGIGASHGTH